MQSHPKHEADETAQRVRKPSVCFFFFYISAVEGWSGVVGVESGCGGGVVEFILTGLAGVQFLSGSDSFHLFSYRKYHYYFDCLLGGNILCGLNN